MLLGLAACTVKVEGGGGDSSDGPETADSAAADTFEPTETGDAPDTGEAPETGETAPAPVALLINELMADNETAVTDDLGQVSDWVELYNAGEVALDLSGVTLSDDWTQPALYTLPDGTTLEAGGYLVLWADGLPDLGDLHMGFKLAQDGEAVGVFDAAGESLDWVVFGAQQADTALARIPDGGETWEEVSLGTPGESNAIVTLTESALVSSGDLWRYDDRGVDLGVAWVQPDYDDSAWSSGPSPLGYGDTHATTVSYGADGEDKHPTTYFRLQLEVDPALLAGARAATLEIQVDDGALVWLNGEEVVRQNMPDGEIAWADYASASTSDESAWTSYAIDAELLTERTVLAVEVHQANGSSSDLQLDLRFTLTSVVQGG